MAIGLDAGTGNLISAESGTGDVNIQRNAFISIPKKRTTKKQLKRMEVPYIDIEGELFIVGKDAFEYANIFNTTELRRPMQDGMLNPTEQDALPVMKHIIGSIVGSSDKGEIAVYSIPANPIDSDRQVDYHSDTVSQILEFFGFYPIAMNEAQALGNIGLKENGLTGIAISLGSGLANLAVMYKGLSAIQFSVTKAGDWISEKVAADTGISVAKANKIKESSDYSIAPSSSDRRTREQQAVKSYYESLIRYLLSNVAYQFEQSAETPEFPEEVPIVVGGGTSMVDGFVELFEEQFTQQDFPIDISEIRLVEEPLTAVARGCREEAKMEEEADGEE